MVFGTLLKWIKLLIAAIVALFAGPDQGLAIPLQIAPDPVPLGGWLCVPLQIAPDPPRSDQNPWLDIPLEVATMPIEEHPTSATLSLPSSSCYFT